MNRNGSNKIIEYAAGLLLFLRSMEKVLLICDEKGVWRFPSGRLEDSESFLDAAVRELCEETNIHITEYIVVITPIPVVSRKVFIEGNEEAIIKSKVRMIYPAILKSAELPSVAPIIGITSDAAWLTVEEAVSVTANRKRAAAISLSVSAIQGLISEKKLDGGEIRLGSALYCGETPL